MTYHNPSHKLKKAPLFFMLEALPEAILFGFTKVPKLVSTMFDIKLVLIKFTILLDIKKYLKSNYIYIFI